MKIIYKLANSSNYAKRTNKKNEWIVLHYTGNNNDTAKGNANYFSNPVIPVRSANYFVDEKEIYCSVIPDNMELLLRNIIVQQEMQTQFILKCVIPLLIYLKKLSKMYSGLLNI